MSDTATVIDAIVCDTEEDIDEDEVGLPDFAEFMEALTEEFVGWWRTQQSAQPTLFATELTMTEWLSNFGEYLELRSNEDATASVTPG